MTQTFMRLPGLKDRNLKHLKSVTGGAMVVPPELVRRIDETFGGAVAFGTGYGMTEATSSIATIAGPEYVEFPTSVGHATPVNELKICDDQGEGLPIGEVGELWAKGANFVRGYWNRSDATDAAFVHGWHRTGDMARLDEAGRLFLVDRLKDIVIRNGENVYCAEVEGVIYDHPDVQTVAVVGYPHAEWGEEVLAVVRLNVGASMSLEDLQTHVRTKLARFKAPTRLVVTSEDLPRTATGKILKRELAALVTG